MNHRGEIPHLNRWGKVLASFQYWICAGLPVYMRRITNIDEIGGLKFENEKFLDDLIKKYKIKKEEILELLSFFTKNV